MQKLFTLIAAIVVLGAFAQAESVVNATFIQDVPRFYESVADLPEWLGLKPRSQTERHP